MSWKQRTADRSPAVQRSRQRSIDQTREIIDAAHRLTMGGDPDFTVQRLIAEAGIALQTFYRYFSGKDELLMAMLEDMIANGTQRIGAVAARETDPLRRLRSVMGQVAGADTATPGPGGAAVTHLHFELQEKYPHEVEAAIGPYVALVRGCIDDAAAAGLVDPLDPARDARAITRVVLATYHNAAVGAPDADPEAAAEHLFRFCVAALRPTGSPAPVATVRPRRR